jgi:enterochelin esterase-like enzyme
MSTLKNKIGITLSLIVCAVLAVVALVALSPSGLATATAPAGPMAMPANAPTVNPDRTVTFSLKAPQATDVKLNFQNQRGASPAADAYPMTKDANGVWSITMGPLAPDMYGYDFILDGVKILDPTNTYSGPGTVRAVWAGNPGSWSDVNAWSYVTVPGPEADFFADAPDVPHGAVATVRYYSTLAETERQMQVYTPPGYNHDNRRYPVLYIMHGGGGNDTDWIVNMRANYILDNLIAAGKVVPMILVSPDGYLWPTGSGGEGAHDLFPEELIGSIVPYIEENYRAAPGGKNRALAGLSLGARWTMDTLLQLPGEFAYIGSFSGRLSVSTCEDLIQNHTDLLTNPDINKWTKLFWYTFGGPDDLNRPGVAEDVAATLGMFDQFNIKYTNVDGPSIGAIYGHIWDTWRHHLLAFSQLLFK